MLPKNRISTHPGEILLEEFLKPMGITQSELARHIEVNPHVICEICHKRRAVSPSMALKLGAALNVSAEFWSGLQADYDLTKAMQEGVQLNIQPLLAGVSFSAR